LYENNPSNVVQVDDLIQGRRVIIFGTPGAFTPICSQNHLPGFIKEAEKLKERGEVQEIICIAVNDPYVMAEWGKLNNADGKVRLLADTAAEFTRSLGLVDSTNSVLGSWRCKRFSLVLNDGVVIQLNVEPDSNKATCSSAEHIKF